jgi:hypothetical protein
LNPDFGGEEIIAAADIGQMILDKRLLEGNISLGSDRALAHVRIYDPTLCHIEAIDVEDGRQREQPVKGFEGSITVEKFESVTVLPREGSRQPRLPPSSPREYSKPTKHAPPFGSPWAALHRSM